MPQDTTHSDPDRDQVPRQRLDAADRDRVDHDEAYREKVTRSVNGKYLGKTRLLTRSQIDKRTAAAQEFDAIAKAIAQDLGGEDRLSTVQKHLVEAFAGCAIHVGHINALLALGQDVDILVHSNAISTMCRVASRIGTQRIARDVTPSVKDYVASLRDEEAEA
jgi:hypothetical protein